VRAALTLRNALITAALLLLLFAALAPALVMAH
jgi:hypothetical protein